MNRTLAARIALPFLVLSVVVSSPSCWDDSELEGESRDLGELTVGGATFAVGATLVGRYRRARGGGGRMTCTYATSDEIWTTGVALAPRAPDVEVLSLGLMQDTGDDWDEAVEVLESLALEQCPRPGGRSLVFRVVGLSGSGWQALYVGDGVALTGPFESSARTCAEAATAAPSTAAFLGTLWEDGLRAWVDLEEQRESRPGSGMTEEMRRRKRYGETACAQLLRLGEAREGVRCGLALRALAEQHAGGPIADAIRAGAGAPVDAEAALFELVAPAGLPTHDDPAMQAVVERHTASTIRGYLDAAPTRERRLAFFDANVERCGAATFPCEPWRVAALADVAGEAEDSARCERMREVAQGIIADGSANAGVALTVLKATSGCGDEESFRVTAMAGLSRPTLQADDDGGRGRCRRTFGGPDDFRTTPCGSLPRYAGEWLRRHCSPEAVERALAILEATPGAEGTLNDGPTDGAARILAGCDRPALDRFIEARQNESMRVLTADY